MALSYLLDTNTISEMERMQPNTNIAQRISHYQGQLAISSVSWHEILYGYHRLPTSKRKERVAYFITNTVLPNLPILPYDQAAAEWFARERARLVSSGRTPVYADGQIAAIAATNNLTLVTRNTADFTDFQQLQLTNWFK